MKLVLQRLDGGKDTTPGQLWHEGACFCLTLEDEARVVKVKGETRIPAGTYELKLRAEGGMHQRYKQLFGGAHKGMLELQNVPDFTYVYLHVGNTNQDTSGCILVGESLHLLNGEYRLGNSRSAYHRLLKLVHPELLKGRLVEVVVIDPR